MIDTMWVAQAAQSGDVAGVGASDFFGNTAQMLENGFTLIVSLFASLFLTVVNIALFYEIHDDTKDGCGCGGAWEEPACRGVEALAEKEDKASETGWKWKRELGDALRR